MYCLHCYIRLTNIYKKPFSTYHLLLITELMLLKFNILLVNIYKLHYSPKFIKITMYLHQKKMDEKHTYKHLIKYVHIRIFHNFCKKIHDTKRTE